MTRLCLLFPMWLSSAGAAPANPTQADDAKAIRAAADAFSAAWGRADANALAALFASDGTLVTPDESDVRGRENIEALLAQDLTGLFRGTTSVLAIRSIRWVGPAAAWIDVDQFVDEMHRPDGGALPQQRLLLTALLSKDNGRWLFQEVRAFAPLPRRDPASFRLTRTSLPLTSGGGPVLMDYLETDRESGQVWIPASSDGSVDVLEPATGKMTRIPGFPTVDVEIFGHPAKAGPTAVALGDRTAYIGNRGDASLCAVDARTLKKGQCLKVGSQGGLAASVDGLAYVQATHEVWATLGAPPLGVSPTNPGVMVFDASKPGALKLKATVSLPEAPEGYAVDDMHGLFFTNLDDANQTVAIDVHSHQVVSRWPSGCGEGGPRGLAADPKHNWVFVACVDRVVVLDAAHQGKQLGSAPAGMGIDNIDYLPSRSQLYVAAGVSGLLTLFGVNAQGRLGVLAAAPTARGARVVVAGNDGTAYVADSAGGQLLVFSASR